MTEPLVHVIDDDPGVREAIELMFSTAGIATRGYGSAEAFLYSEAALEPACVVLDNRLPGMSGLELLRRLRDDNSEATVVMLTGHADVPTAVAAMKLGAFHFIEKPLDGETLLNAVEEALSRAEKQFDGDVEVRAFHARRATLSPREAEVFALLIEGAPTKVIATSLDLSTRTAEHHRAAVMRKLQAKSISHLMRMALNLK
ncbi:MAG: response regulator transcription factor [Roseiarcus sp.]